MIQASMAYYKKAIARKCSAVVGCVVHPSGILCRDYNTLFANEPSATTCSPSTIRLSAIDSPM